MNFAELDFTATKELIRNRELRCTDITQYYLDRIRDNSDINAFISVFEESAMKQAKNVDAKLDSGQAGDLAGLVLGVKDLLVMKQGVTTCGSHILDNFQSPYDATVIERLAEQDVIFIGKTNMDEFAMGSSNETSYFKPVRNPHDKARVPGGSSGGSAAAVAAGLCPAALGTDTGGSIRQPASFCGVVGLKPTYGRISRFGLVAYASSLDQIGPLTMSVRDTALLLQHLAGHDEKDSTCARVQVPDYSANLGRDVKGLRIGLPKEYFTGGVDPQTTKAIEAVIQEFKDNGAEIVEVSLPHTEYAISAYYIIATAEASANLARYDGVRYGFRAPDVDDLESLYVNSRTAGFGSEVKRRIMLGTYVLSSGYYDAYYRKALQVRTLITRDFHQAFESVDCLLTPTSPTTAFKLGEKTDDPLTMYLSDVFTVSVNLAGLPGISVPCARDDAGLPIGVQLLSKPFDETTLLWAADFVDKRFNKN